jgi:nucleotidyltransferase substrate binding protein (TIGR01987 family)
MDRINLRVTHLNKALARFNESINLFKATNSGDKLYTQLRDSVIKRFEFSVDIFWKCLKDYLNINHKINVASPKAVMQECFNQRVINETDLQMFMNMIDDRN